MERPDEQAQRPRRGEELELRIDSVAQGGSGVARADGYVVFVSGALPGDLVKAEVTKSKRRHGEARTVELLEPSPERVPFEGEHQPGAPWVELPYERQLEIKEELCLEALSRLGGLDDFDFESIDPAVSQWRYRNKFEYTFGEEEDGELVCGFHPRGRWDVVVDSVDNPLASEAVNAARAQVVEWARQTGLPAYDPRERMGVLRNLVIREGRRTGQVQTRLVTSMAAIPEPPVDLLTRIEGDAGSTEGPIEVLGREELEEEICGLRLRISPEAFFQTNTEMAERLYEVAIGYADLDGAERVFDLYCGIGTIGLVMARHAGEVWGVDVIPEAVTDAARNAQLNGIANATFRAGSARTALRPLLEEAGPPDVVVVDPPRAGLSPKIVRRILECNAQRIVYVSCNPTTLAPEAALMEEGGYKLRRVRPVDMFPQTPHVECVAVLERN